MEIFIEPDGAVVIGDLLADLIPVARALDGGSEAELKADHCPVPEAGAANEKES